MVAADGASSAVRAARAGDFGPSLDPRYCRYMWLGTDLVFDAFKFFIEETPARACSRLTRIPTTRDEHVHRREREEIWRRAGLDAVPAGPLPPGVSDDGQRPVLRRELFADALEGHELFANNSKWINFTTVRNAAGARTTWSCSATPPTPPTSRSARGPSWPWRTRSRWPGRFARCGVDDVAGALRPTRPSAVRSSRAPSVPPRPRWSGSRGSPLRRPGPDAVRLQPADPQPPRHLRQPAPARPGVRRSRSSDADGTATARRCSPRSRLRGLELPNRVIVSPMDMYSAVRMGRPRTSTSSISAPARWAARRWSTPR